MSKPQNARVARAPAVSMYAERTSYGWRWESAGGVIYRLEWQRRRGVWIARTDRHGSTHFAERPGPGAAIAADNWPQLARSVFRRTLRPNGVMR